MNWADIPILNGLFAKKNHTQKSGTIIPDVTPATISTSQNAPHAWTGKTIDLTITTGASTITFDSADGWKDKDWTLLRIISNSGAYKITYAGATALTTVNDEGLLGQKYGSVYAEVVGTNVRLTGKLL